MEALAQERLQNAIATIRGIVLRPAVPLADAQFLSHMLMHLSRVARMTQPVRLNSYKAMWSQLHAAGLSPSGKDVDVIAFLNPDVAAGLDGVLRETVLGLNEFVKHFELLQVELEPRLDALLFLAPEAVPGSLRNIVHNALQRKWVECQHATAILLPRLRSIARASVHRGVTPSDLAKLFVQLESLLAMLPSSSALIDAPAAIYACRTLVCAHLKRAFETTERSAFELLQYLFPRDVTAAVVRAMLDDVKQDVRFCADNLDDLFTHDSITIQQLRDMYTALHELREVRAVA